MTTVEFVDHAPQGRGNSSTYDEVAAQLAKREGDWGRFVEVTDVKDLRRWIAAMRYRRVRVSQRKIAESHWQLFGCYDSSYKGSGRLDA